MTGLRNLSAPHAKPPASLPEGKCSLILCPPHAFSPRTAPILISTGVWGLAPCFPIALDLALFPCGCRKFSGKRVWGQSAPTLRKARGLPLPPAGVSGFCQNAPGKLGFCSLLLYTIIGKFESFFLFYIYGYSPRLQNSHTAFSLLRRPYRTRMTEQQNLPAPHAKPEIGQSGSKCSHRPRRPGQIYTNKSAGYGAEPHVNQRP